MAYRHLGKSHLVSLYIAWRLYLDPNYTCLIVSSTKEHAADNSILIRKIIEGHPLTAHLVNDEKWSAEHFTVKRPKVSRNPSVRCASLESGITGKHCLELIADDIESSDNCLSEENREKLRRKILEFVNIADKQIMFIGTPHHSQSIYPWLEKDMGYELKFKLPVLNKNGKSVWPERFDDEWLADQKAKQGNGWFDSQMMLVPTSVEESLIDVSFIEEYDHELEVMDMFDWEDEFKIVRIGDKNVKSYGAYWDMATGLTGRDRSVFAVACKTDDDHVWLHRVVELPPTDPHLGYEPQCEVIVDHCIDLGLSTVIVEKMGAATIDIELKKAFKRRHKAIHIRHIPRTIKKQKYIAEAIGPYVQAKRFHVHNEVVNESHFMSELRDFPHSRKDDCIDAAAGAISNLAPDTFNPQGTSLMKSHFRGGQQFTMKRERPLYGRSKRTTSRSRGL